MMIDIPKHIQLLIIEDTQADQLSILDAIKKADIYYDFIMAVSVKEAKSRLKNNPFDLILSEYQLHDGVVLELLPEAKETPIIVVTRFSNEAVALRTMKAGVYDYLIKDSSGRYLTVLPMMIQSVLRRKKLEIEEHDQRLFAETLRDTASALNSTLELDEILRRILENVKRIIPHDSSSIMLVHNGIAKVALCSGWHPDAIPIILSTQFLIDKVDHFRVMYTTRGFCTIPNIADSAGWVSVEGMNNPHSYLGAPICINNEVIGFLNLDSDTVNHFTPIHAERLRAFVDQAAIALQNARLFQKAQELATIEERQRLARDLHDSVTQTLFAIAMTTQAILKHWKHNPMAVGDSLEELQDLSQGALAEVRTLLLELRPSAVLEADLGDLIRQLCATTKGRSRLQVNFHARGKAITPSETHVAFFRIAQEALNNIIKHARAKHADIYLTRQLGRVELVIQDDGTGFNINHIPPSHLGLRIMQERAHDANITLSITSTPKTGTKIIALWTQKES